MLQAVGLCLVRVRVRVRVGVGVGVGVRVRVRIGAGAGLGLGLGTHPQPLARLRLLRVLNGGRAALQPSRESLRLRHLPPEVACEAHLHIGLRRVRRRWQPEHSTKGSLTLALALALALAQPEV